MTTAVSDWLAVATHDAVTFKALGLIASGALILLWAALKITPKKIGA